MKLCFATNNKGKLKEIKSLLQNQFEILSLEDIGCFEEIPETGKTLEENALLKARFVHQKYQINCFSDDSGLEVVALGGRPGVYSARYAGPENDSDKNMDKLLFELKGENNRRARFRTCISLLLKDKEYIFEGEINGNISLEKKGENGFGYDPIFVPEGNENTFAEMSIIEKNGISHRALAVSKLVAFFNTIKMNG